MLRRAFSGLIRKRVEFRHRIKGFNHIYTNLGSDDLNVTEFRLYGKTTVDGVTKRLIPVGGTGSDDYGKIPFKQTGINLIGGRELVALFNKYCPGSFTESEDGTYATFHKNAALSITINDPTIFTMNPNIRYTFFGRHTYPTAKSATRDSFFVFYASNSYNKASCKTSDTDGTAMVASANKKVNEGIGLYLNAEDGIIVHYDTFGILYGVHASIKYYEEYKERRGEISLRAPLRGIGPYCDVLDFLNQSVTRKIENKIISSASEIEITEDGFYKAHLSVRGRDDGDILCNHLEFKSIEELATSPGIAIEQGGEAVIFRLSNAKGTAEELEAYLEANGGICFDYVKEVFTEEKYSDSVLSPKGLFSKDYSAIQLLTEGIPKKFYVEYVNTEEI